jgi:hypothetical protein
VGVARSGGWQSIEQLPWLHLDRFGESFHRGDLRIPLPSLDPADLSSVDAASFSNLFLGQFKPLARLAKIGAEGRHGRNLLFSWREPPWEISQVVG